MFRVIFKSSILRLKRDFVLKRNRSAEGYVKQLLFTKGLRHVLDWDGDAVYLNLTRDNEHVTILVFSHTGIVLGLPATYLEMVQEHSLPIVMGNRQYLRFAENHWTWDSYVGELVDSYKDHTAFEPFFEITDIPEAQGLVDVALGVLGPRSDESVSKLIDTLVRPTEITMAAKITAVFSHLVSSKHDSPASIIASAYTLAYIVMPQHVSKFIDLCVNTCSTIPVAQVFDDSLLKALLGTVFSVLMLGALPRRGLVNNIVKNMGDITRIFAAGPRALDNYKEILSSVYDSILFYMWGTKTSKLQELEHLVEGLANWEKQVLEILTLDFRMEIVKSESKCKLVESLYFEGFRYSSILDSLRLPPTQLVHFRRLFDAVHNMFKMVDDMGVAPYSPRRAPLTIYLYGGPGVGKTSIVSLIGARLLSKRDRNLGKDWQNQMYYRNTAQDFWDGYHGQMITVYDDFAQVKDCQTNGNMEFLELIRTGNIAPFPLHKASMQEKSKSFFSSEYVICTSNVGRPNVSSLVEEKALFRRFDVCVEVQIAEKYLTFGKLDPNKQKNILGTVNFDPRIYEFIPYRMVDFSSIHMSRSVRYSFSQFMDTLYEKDNKCGKFEQSVIDYINTEMPAAEVVDDVVLPYDAFEIGDDDYDYAPGTLRWEILGDISAYFTEYIKDPLGVTGRLINRGLVKYHPSQFKPTSWYVSGAWNAVSQNYKLIGGVLATLGVLFVGAKTYQHFTKSSPSAEPAYVPLNLVEGSGDNLTRATKPIVREVVSGDDVTGKTRVHVEAVSGDNMTTKPGVVVEMTSGDNLTRSPKIMIEGMPAVEGTTDVNCNEIANNVLPKNLYRLYTVDNDGNVAFRLMGYFVRGKLLLTVAHFLPYIKNYPKLLLRNAYAEFQVFTNEIVVHPLADTRDEDKDAMILEMPKYVQPHPDLTKHLVSRSDLHRFTSCQGIVTLLNETNFGVCPSQIHTPITSIEGVVYSDGPQTRLIRNGYMYRAATSKGYCGAPLLIEANAIQRKIVGLHVAGHLATSMGYSISITSEDIDRALAQCRPVSQCDQNDLPMAHSTYTPEGSFTPLGQINTFYAQPRKTDIVPSPIHDKVTKHTTLPSVLKPGRGLNPLETGLKKAGAVPPLIKKKYLDRAFNSIKQTLMFEKASFRRKLTLEEAVFGIEGEEFINSINRKASPGFGWSKKTEPGKPGKSTWMGEDQNWFIHDDLKHAIMNMENELQNNKRVRTYWIDTLKDERRPIAKVQAGKTRVFANGQMDYLVLLRQYTLGFLDHVMKNRIFNGIAVGINPTSFEWSQLVQHLRKVGDNMIAGDFSSFDGSVSAQILSYVVRLCQDFYDNKFDNEIELLFQEILFSRHVNGDKIYQWNHAHPSGSPVTAVLNSLVVNFLVRCTFYHAIENTSYAGASFDEKVRVIAYGDDVIFSVHPSVHEVYNPNTVVTAMGLFGMTFTDEKKSGTVFPFRSITDVSFLKRGFVNRGGIWRAPLEIEVILESLNWVRDENMVDVAFLENLKGQMENLAEHGEDVYNHWVPVIRTAVVNANISFVFQTYEEVEEVLVERF